MIIYADILIIVNFLVDYFLFLSVGYFLKERVKTLRYIAGAFVGGVSSLYIFVSIENIFLDIIHKLFVSVICSLVVFGFKGIKRFIKSLLSIIFVTCCFGGIMTVIWNIFKPEGMFAKNNIIYFNISPIVLIGLTVAFYLLFIILSLIFKPSAIMAKKCNVKIFAQGKKIDFTAIIDSGNSINDVFGKSDIIIVDKRVAVALFDNIDINVDTNAKSRYRVIPCGTVGGSEMLDGFRCDKGELYSQGQILKLDKPILAISKLPLNDDYEGIVNPEIFN